jgi:hypothetical protein
MGTYEDFQQASKPEGAVSIRSFLLDVPFSFENTVSSSIFHFVSRFLYLVPFMTGNAKANGFKLVPSFVFQTPEYFCIQTWCHAE